MDASKLNLNPLAPEQIDPVVIVAIIVIFAITFLLLRRVFVLPYVRVMEGRQQLFATADARAEQAAQVVRDADFTAEQSLAQAARSAEQLRADASERAAAYRRERVEEAAKRASELLEHGRANIADAREKETALLRQQAVDCVGLACSQLLGGSTNGDAEAAVDRLMARRVN